MGVKRMKKCAKKGESQGENKVKRWQSKKMGGKKEKRENKIKIEITKYNQAQHLEAK